MNKKFTIIFIIVFVCVKNAQGAIALKVNLALEVFQLTGSENIDPVSVDSGVYAQSWESSPTPFTGFNAENSIDITVQSSNSNIEEVRLWTFSPGRFEFTVFFDSNAPTILSTTENFINYSHIDPVLKSQLEHLAMNNLYLEPFWDTTASSIEVSLTSVPEVNYYGLYIGTFTIVGLSARKVLTSRLRRTL